MIIHGTSGKSIDLTKLRARQASPPSPFLSALRSAARGKSFDSTDLTVETGRRLFIAHYRVASTEWYPFYALDEPHVLPRHVSLVCYTLDYCKSQFVLERFHKFLYVQIRLKFKHDHRDVSRCKLVQSARSPKGAALRYKFQWLNRRVRRTKGTKSSSSISWLLNCRCTSIIGIMLG